MKSVLLLLYNEKKVQNPSEQRMDAGILVHAFVDILSVSFTGGIEGNMFTRVEAILTSFICLGVSLYLIRPAKQQEIKEKFGWIFVEKMTEAAQQEQG